MLITILLCGCHDIANNEISPNPNPSHDASLYVFGSSNLSKDQTLYFWADEEQPESKTDYFKSWLLTVQDDGSLSSNTHQKYPEENSVLKLFGMHGGNIDEQITENDSPFPGNLDITVQADQTVPTNYENSDLIYEIREVKKEDEKQAVNVDLHHMLSNICVELKADKNSKFENSDIQDAKVRIMNVKTKTSFTPKKDIDLSQPDAAKSMIGTAEGTQADIQIPTGWVKKEASGFDDNRYGKGVIVPQTIEGNTKLLEVKIKGFSLYYTIPATESESFEAGKEYRFNVTVGDELHVTTSGGEWTNGGDVPPTNLILEGVEANEWADDNKDQNTDDQDDRDQIIKIGDFIYSNGENEPWTSSDGGHYFDPNGVDHYVPKRPDKNKGNLIGVVIYVNHPVIDGDDEIEDYKYKLGGDGFNYCGYVVSIKDAKKDDGSYEMPWYNPDVEFDQNLNTEFSQSSPWSTYGYVNHQALLEDTKEGGEDPLDRRNMWAWFYGTQDAYDGTYTAPSSTTGWFLPSPGEFGLMKMNLNSINQSIQQIKNSGTKADADLLGGDNGDTKYWTSVQRRGKSGSYENKIFYFGFDLPSYEMEDDNYASDINSKNVTYRVRPILVLSKDQLEQ